MRRAALALAVAALTLTAPRASAGKPTPLSITVAGGVSLGAYEAGFQFYTLELARLNPEAFDLRLVTGASAGSLNGFLTILAYCGRPVAAPRHSLFWEAWIPLGYDRMFAPHAVTPLGMFSRQWGDTVTKDIYAEWQRPASHACDVVLGVTATRLVPKRVRVAHDRLAVARVEEKFVLRIQAAGKGARLTAHNYVDPRRRTPHALLVTSDDGEVAFSSLRDLLYASMSFPIAFEPQPVKHCLVMPDDPLRCRAEDAVTEPFIDGGVFDNTPLRLAVRLANTLSEAEWRFWFVDPDLADYPLLDENTHDLPKSLLSFVFTFANQFISTARKKNLYTVLEEAPHVAQQVVLPQRHYPTASSLLAAFFGFFETDFRIFDFYLGMYDAHRTFHEQKHDVPPVWPEDVYLPGDDPRVALGGWGAFACMQSVFDDEPERRRFCDGESMRAFRTLLQIALERLYDTCARADNDEALATRNPRCRAAAERATPPTVSDVTTKEGPIDAWRLRPGESDVHYVLRLLARHHFHFNDLGIGYADAEDAMFAIRRLVSAAFDRLVSAQPSSGRALLRLVGDVGGDYLAYAPPMHVLYFVLGRQMELGWSVTDPRAGRIRSSFRFNLGLLFDGLNTVLSSDKSRFGVGLAAGLELQPTTLSNGFVQPRLVLRAGYVFATGDHFLAERCTVKMPTEQVNDCSRFVTQLVLGVTVLERVRLQVMASWYPAFQTGERHLWTLTPEVGVQFPF